MERLVLVGLSLGLRLLAQTATRLEAQTGVPIHPGSARVGHEPDRPVTSAIGIRKEGLAGRRAVFGRRLSIEENELFSGGNGGRMACRRSRRREHRRRTPASLKPAAASSLYPSHPGKLTVQAEGRQPSEWMVVSNRARGRCRANARDGATAEEDVRWIFVPGKNMPVGGCSSDGAAYRCSVTEGNDSSMSAFRRVLLSGRSRVPSRPQHCGIPKLLPIMSLFSPPDPPISVNFFSPSHPCTTNLNLATLFLFISLFLSLLTC